MKTDKDENVANAHLKVGSRRDFLKKSVRAAYTTPTIVALAVSRNAQAMSQPGACRPGSPAPEGLPPC